MLWAIALAIHKGVVRDGVEWPAVSLTHAARWVLAVVAAPIVGSPRLSQPLLQLNGAEAGDVLGLLAGLTAVLLSGIYLLFAHHAPRALRLEHGAFHLPFDQHCRYEMILWKFLLAAAVAEDQLCFFANTVDRPLACFAGQGLGGEALPPGLHLRAEVGPDFDGVTSVA